jgi:hypothetical protein
MVIKYLGIGVWAGSMISKREVLKKYLLWRKLYSPNSLGGYPHCLYCRYLGESCHLPQDVPYYHVYYEGIGGPTTKYYIRKSKRRTGEKCLLAFVPGNWVQRSYVG